MVLKVSFVLEDMGYMPEIPNSWLLKCNLKRCVSKRRV